MFADCPPAVEVDGSCELEDRYPGFWVHVLVNVAYSVGRGGACSVALVRAVHGAAQRRAWRGSTAAAALERYRAARERLGLLAGVTAALAVLPIVVALPDLRRSGRGDCRSAGAPGSV